MQEEFQDGWCKKPTEDRQVQTEIDNVAQGVEERGQISSPLSIADLGYYGLLLPS